MWWFYWVAELLGVRLFKRYWPVNGSFWNTEHMNKDRVEDVEETLRMIKEFTRQHVQMSILATIVAILGYIFEIEQMDLRSYFYIVLPMQLYPFLVQIYNYYKAQDRLQYLQNRVPISEMTLDPHPIAIKTITDADHRKYYNKTATFRAPTVYQCEIFGSQVASPYFRTREECLNFRERIYATFGTDFVDLYNNVKHADLAALNATASK